MRGCGGWFKQYNRERMLKLLKENRLNPEKMPCAELKRQAVRMKKGRRSDDTKDKLELFN